MLIHRYLHKYYKKYAWLYIIGIITLIAIDFIQVLIPKLLGEITTLLSDGALTETATEKILVNCGWILAIGGGMFIGRIIWRYTIFMASQKIEAGIRHDMFLKSERLSISYYHDNNVGTVMAWFTTDLETLEEFLGWGTVMLIDAIFLTIFALVFMFICCWQLSLIALLPMSLIIVWGSLVEKLIGDKWAERQKAFDELYDYSQESFTGIRVIKAFVKENQQLFAFAKVARKNQKVNLAFGKLHIFFDLLIELIIALILTIIICLAGYFVYSAIVGKPIMLFGMKIRLALSGDFMEYVGYFDTLIWPLIALGQVVSMRSRAKASLKRIARFLDSPEDISNPVDPILLGNIKGEIVFKNFTFTYPNGKKSALNDLNFTIKAGETIGIVGKIGCGKSTLMNVLLRLYNVDEETVFIDGNDIMKCDIDSIRHNIAYVPQDNFLFSDMIKNNVGFSNEEMDFDNVINATKFADVHDDITSFSNGYETISGERGVTLSGGQKQRISIARAYAKDAPIMILDDSVSAVDVKTEEKILENVRTNRRGKTTIFIASRVSTVSHLDRIMVLCDGKLEAFDTYDNLMKISPFFQKMVHLQELEQESKGGE